MARKVETIRDHRHHPELQQWQDTGRSHSKCTFYAPEILVVNDGSTDETPEILNQEANLHIITHPVNQGKGVALKHGLSFAKKQGFRYAITIDSDGQHFASDIPVLIEAIEKEPDTLLVGSRNLTSDNMPGKNTFANKFSNFWFTLETGIKLQDTQSGYRLYPIQRMNVDKWYYTAKYEFELEALVLQHGEAFPLKIFRYTFIIRHRKNGFLISARSVISPVSVF